MPGALVTIAPPRLWCRDLISCLQSTFGTIVDRAGGDPVEVLGTHWEFRYRPGGVRTEEFYYPGGPDLGHHLAPYHGVHSTWHRADGEAPLADLRDELAAGRLVIAAVDNYHLPFRPAFGDVHAAHLLVVYGIDEENGTVHVSDAMPPAYSGPISDAAFQRAWTSANPADEDDAFFSDSRIDRRYLKVTIDPPPAPLSVDLLHTALDASVHLFTAPAKLAGGPDRTGLDGLDRYLDSTVELAAAGDGRALREVYPLGWAMQAQASLHGELLRTWGSAHGLPALCEAGRLVDTVAHMWTGLRMCAAHGHADPAAVLAELTRHAGRLRQAYAVAVAGVEEARCAL